jgi:DNA polymerase theta
MNAPLAPLQSCLSGCLERALVEVIGAGAVTHPEDVQNWLQCTLLYHQSAWDEVHRVAVLALEYLAKNRFTEWTKEERYVPTLLGEATFCSSLPPQAAIWVAGELVVARKNFVLDTDLHLIYQVTPVNEGPEPNWEMMPHLLAGLSERERKVAGLIGIEEGRLVLWANPNRRPRYGASDKHVVRAKRFFQALMLSALIREVPISAVSEKYRVPRGTLQSLQQQAAQFAKLVSGFCGRLNWWDMEVLTATFAKRINYGCQIDILPLCQIPYVRGARARALFTAGLRTVAAVATASLDVVREAISAKSAFTIRRRYT